MTKRVLDLIRRFQRTGKGFEGLWEEIQPHIEHTVRKRLRTRLVKSASGGDDEAAVADVTQQVAVRLLSLPGRRRGWFDESKGQQGVNGLKGWLYRIAANEVAEYCEAWHGARPGRKVIATSGLTYNDRQEADAILKSAVAKVEVDRTELCRIVNEVVERLEDEGLQQLVRLRLAGWPAERKLAERLGQSVSMIHRRLHEAYDLLRDLLAERGVDADWILPEAA